MPKSDLRAGLDALNTPNFRLRLLSAAILAPLVLGAVFFGGWAYTVLVTLIVTLGLREWLRLVDPALPKPVALLAYASLLATMLLAAGMSVAFGAMLGLALVLVLFFVASTHPRASAERAGWVTLGIPYMAGSGLAMLYLRAVPDHGAALTYYLLAVVWGTDIGAYLAGRLIGGPKLAPDISPSKTWAGLFGGMALAAVCGYAVHAGLNVGDVAVLVVLAMVMAVVSQFGDLFESYFKRRSGVKESGGLIPGHGGILDRIDGLVFAAIFLMLFHIAVGDRIAW